MISQAIRQARRAGIDSSKATAQGWAHALIDSRSTHALHRATSDRISNFKLAKLSDFDSRRAGLFATH